MRPESIASTFCPLGALASMPLVSSQTNPSTIRGQQTQRRALRGSLQVPGAQHARHRAYAPETYRSFATNHPVPQTPRLLFHSSSHSSPPPSSSSISSTLPHYTFTTRPVFHNLYDLTPITYLRLPTTFLSCNPK